MRHATKNTFRNGIQLDAHISAVPADTATMMRNFRILSQEGKSFIVTNIQGTEQKGAITNGYVPVACEEISGVAYILSAEVVSGAMTGKGEIGCFPSPASSGNSLTYVYQPLKNYGGDNNESPSLNGIFQSTKFNFNESYPVEIELQNDYDGSVNIIFTDGYNKIRIINSGFAVVAGNTFIYPDRTGSKDTNKYSVDNWNNIINLISRSIKLMRAEFISVAPGGKVKSGENRYYFAYATADGTVTDIVAESQNVSIFKGTNIGDISSGRGDGEDTDRLVNIKLHNIDTAYRNLVVYFVFNNGIDQSVKTAFKIDRVYTITGSTFSFVHTGYESLIPIDINTISTTTPVIDTVGSITQAQGHLILGNIKQKTYDYASLASFARKIKVGSQEVKLDFHVPQSDSDMTSFVSTVPDQVNPVDGTAGYNAGYYNAKNNYLFKGYMGGETYPFGVQFLINDGSESPVFPVSAIDNNSGGNDAVLNAITLSNLDSIAAGGGYSSDGTMTNTKGIYRFKSRKNSTNILFGSGQITVNGVTFKIPDLTTVLPNGKTIKDSTIGIRFMRADRNPDMLTQGMFVDCLMIPNIRYDQADVGDLKLWNYPFSASNSYLIPAFNYFLESINSWAPTGDSPSQRAGSTNVHFGIVPFRQNFVCNNAPINSRDPQLVLSTLKSPFGFYSPDSILNPISFRSHINKDIAVDFLYDATHIGLVKSARQGQSEGTGDHFSVLIPNSYTKKTAPLYSGKSSYVSERMDANALGFSGQSFVQGEIKGGDYAVFRQIYNEYLGIRLNASIRAGIADTNTAGIGSAYFGMYNQNIQASFIGNIYSGSGPRTPSTIQTIYSSIDGLVYTPISDKIYWDNTIEDADSDNLLVNKLDGSGKILLFGGDCNIGLTMRKLSYNPSIYDAPDSNYLARTGYYISMVTESIVNPCFRSTVFLNGNDIQERSFAPMIGASNTKTGDSIGRGNLWREYQQFESYDYNFGNTITTGDRKALTLPENAPFIKSNYFARIMATAQHIPSSFDNGYRHLNAFESQDYNYKNGAIVKLIYLNNALFCIQEKSIGIVPINERIQTGSDKGGKIFVESYGVLSPFMKILSDELGSSHKESIRATDNFVYGYSSYKDKIWQSTPEQVNIISENNVNSYLIRNLLPLHNQPINTLKSNVSVLWNKAFNEIMFTFYDSDFTGQDNFTLVYNEVLKHFYGFFDLLPMKGFSLNNDLYSFNVAENSNRIWKHDSRSEDVDRVLLYGHEQKAVLQFVVNNPTEVNKIFDNLEIVSNNVLPSRIIYRTQGASQTQTINYDKSNIHLSNAKYERETVRIFIPKVMSIDNQDTQSLFTEERANAQSLLKQKSRLQGKNVSIQIEWDSPNLIEINSILTYYRLAR